MKSKEEIQRGVNEMWDAIARIPDSDPAKGLAWDQAADAERKAWQAYQEKPTKTLVSDLIFTAKTLGPPAGWVDDDEWKEWVEFSFDQIGEKYPDDNVFYCTNPTGEPIACYLSTLSLKIQ